ncbi:TonB-dependent receptor [Flavivirga amylovorans]
MTPENTFSQSKVVIDTDKEVSIDEVFKIIKAQTDYTFVYQMDIFKNVPKVQLKKGSIRVDKLLNQSIISKGFNVILSNDNTIIIKKKSKSQQRQVTGKVIGEDGMSLAGVTVLVKGTTRGVSTDFDGKYTISVIDNSNVLMFSSIGYATQEIAVGNQSIIDVTLKEEISELDQITINAGYYKTSKRQATGNISRITSKEIEQQPVNNPLQTLQGRMPGVYIQQNTGVPGGSFEISIRGQNTLRQDGNEPLFLIDGVPYPTESLEDVFTSFANNGGSPLSAINPNDIESIEILKDADATAIYGSRGANGVVVITTKKGNVGESKLNIRLSQGIGKVSHKVDLLNSEQYLLMRNEGFRNDGVILPQFILDLVAPDLFVWDSTRETDWQEELIGGTAEYTNANISLSGGTSQTNYLISGTYFKETTVFPGDDSFKRVSGRFNLNHTSKDNKFSFNLSTLYTNSNSDLPRNDLFNQAITLAPVAPALYDEFGELNWENGTWTNPLAPTKQRSEDITDNFISNLKISYKITPKLKINTSLGYNNFRNDEILIDPLAAINPALLTSTSTGSSRFANGNVKTWIIEPQFEFKTNVSKGSLNLLLGTTIQGTVSEREALLATGFSSDVFLYNVEAATEVDVTNYDFTEYKYSAIYGRLNYTWENKYLLNLTGRRDGSSRFGPNKRFGNFGAIGAGWVFSEEDFIKNKSSFFSYGKLRGSYGSTGNDQIPDYGYLDTFSFIESYNEISSLEVTRLSNPDYSWETVKKLEFGLELGFWEDKFIPTISWYRNRTEDQLVGLPLSEVTGDSQVQFNRPAVVENRGWEIELNATPINTSDFTWSTNINLTIPKNELVEFNNIEEFPVFDNLYEIGRPINGGSRKYYKFTGINPETGRYSVVDFNGDGIINIQDSQNFVELGQEYFGGFQNSFSYKSFQLDFTFQFVKQKGASIARSFDMPGKMSNQPASVLRDRWSNPGDISSHGALSAFGIGGTEYSNFIDSNSNFIDTSFIRLNNISFSFSLPEKFLKQVKLNQFRLFIEGQNIFTLKKSEGNPEIGSSFSIPSLRRLTAGVNIGL